MVDFTKIGQTRRQFKRQNRAVYRSIPPRPDGRDLRSAKRVEHLYENRYLRIQRDVRLDLLKKEAIIGHMARTSIARVVENLRCGRTSRITTSLAAFWGVAEDDRKAIWGSD